MTAVSLVASAIPKRFPAIVTIFLSIGCKELDVIPENRKRWTGLDSDEFELYTTYENLNYCKPNLYY